MSEALFFASTNPQYYNTLFIELQVQYMKIPTWNMGWTYCVQKLFWMSETISVHNKLSPGLTFEQSVVILLFSWCKKKSFWQRFTCKYQQCGQNMLCTEIISDIQNNFCTQYVLLMFSIKKSLWQRFFCKVYPNIFSKCKKINIYFRESNR